MFETNIFELRGLPFHKSIFTDSCLTYIFPKVIGNDFHINKRKLHMKNALRTNKNYCYYYYEHHKTFYTLHWIIFLTGLTTPFKRHRYSMLFSTIIGYVFIILFIRLWNTLWKSIRITYRTQQAYQQLTLWLRATHALYWQCICYLSTFSYVQLYTQNLTVTLFWNVVTQITGTLTPAITSYYL